MPFIPHTDADVEAMLRAIDVPSIEALFEEIPEGLRCGELHALPSPLTEMEVDRLMRARAAANKPLLCFAGAGAYEHHIPSAVWEIATRGEFYSSYTPYQAEASQGTMQVIYEYQTMMARLTAMDVSNASLYEGASALAEAVLMAVRANRRTTSRRILVPRTVHPLYRAVTRTITAAQGIELIEVPYDEQSGRLERAALEPHAQEEIAAVVVPQPNYFGVLEEAGTLTDWAHQRGALVIGLVNPLALALLKPPGRWGASGGADIVCGEGQPLGVPLSYGGPFFGFMCCRSELVRKMPGRIVGRTVDVDGRPAYALTLQAREQHIRRSKATSNICTNQGLMVTAATVHMALLGAEGLRRTAAACHAATRALSERLAAVDGVSRIFETPFFHEQVLRLPCPADEVIDALARRGILGGVSLREHYPELGEALLVCATELRTDEDIARYAEALRAVLSGARSRAAARHAAT